MVLEIIKTMETRHTLFKDLQPNEQTIRLTQMVQQAYFRRSRNLPANLGDMVQTLKGDLVKHIPDITVEDLDLAITTSTLNDPETNLSVAFFFTAAKRQCPQRTNTHNWDCFDEDLSYWRNRRTWLESHGQAGTPQHHEACEMERHYQQGDTEQDTINLLDAMAKYYSVDHRNPLPIFGPPHLFFYLVMRGQLALNADDGLHDAAVQEVNKQRLAARHRPLDHEEAKTSTEVALQAKKLAVLGWLKACNSQGTTPSAILSPLMDSLTYAQHRRING